MSMLPVVKTVECGKGKVKQKTGVEHDINKIMARFKKTGELPTKTDQMGAYLDATGIGDFQMCMEKVAKAKETWLKYPVELRRRFNNDIGIFASVMSRLDIPENEKIAIECGIAKPKAEVKKPDETPEIKNEEIKK